MRFYTGNGLAPTVSALGGVFFVFLTVIGM